MGDILQCQLPSCDVSVKSSVAGTKFCPRYKLHENSAGLNLCATKRQQKVTQIFNIASCAPLMQTVPDKTLYSSALQRVS